MTALEFLEMLTEEYRGSGLHLSASVITFVLKPLKQGNVEYAMRSLADSKEFVLSEMRKGAYETQIYACDLAMLNTIEKMIQEGMGGTNG